MKNPTIKSFKLRGTRITAAQTSARDRLWSRYGMDIGEELLDFSRLFPQLPKIMMEIGFGMGETTAAIAQGFPDTGFLAVDVHQPGIGKLLALIEEADLTNIRVLDEDAHLVLDRMVPKESLDGIHIFFPDPWPKTRHHKRRIVNSEFIELIASKLKPNGYVHLSTDWEPYARWIADRFAHTPKFVGGIVERPDWRPLTRFESQGIKKEHRVADFSYRKI